MDKNKPPPLTVDSLSHKERLQLSILHGTNAICKTKEQSCGNKVTFDTAAVTLIGTLVWRKLQEMGLDLEYFAKHAKIGKSTKKTIIRSHDVLLLARRNTSLKDHLQKLVQVQEQRKKKSSGAADEAGPSNAPDVIVEPDEECNDAAAPDDDKDICVFDVPDDVIDFSDD